MGLDKHAKNRMLAVNDLGLRIGESHPRAKLTDHEVDLLLALREEGYSYSWLAVKLDISKAHVGRIVRGEQRGQAPASYRRALAR